MSAPIETQISETEPTPMDIVSEPETKVSEPIPTTETRTPLGFRQSNETDIKAFRKMISGRPVRTKSKDGHYRYYRGDDIQYLRAEEFEDTQLERDPTFVRISDEEPLVPSRLPRLTSASEGVRRYLAMMRQTDSVVDITNIHMKTAVCCHLSTSDLEKFYSVPS